MTGEKIPFDPAPTEEMDEYKNAKDSFGYTPILDEKTPSRPSGLAINGISTPDTDRQVEHDLGLQDGELGD
jgi:hypothetical protein